MATILKSDLVNNALQELGVQTSNNPAEPEDVAACFDRMEQLMAEYSTAQLTILGYVLGDDISAESGLLPTYVRAFRYILAKDFSQYFQVPLGDPLALQADQAQERIDASVLTIPEIARSELQPRGAGRQGYGYGWLGDRFYINGETDGNTA